MVSTSRATPWCHRVWSCSGPLEYRLHFGWAASWKAHYARSHWGLTNLTLVSCYSEFASTLCSSIASAMTYWLLGNLVQGDATWNHNMFDLYVKHKVMVQYFGNAFISSHISFGFAGTHTRILWSTLLCSFLCNLIDMYYNHGLWALSAPPTLVWMPLNQRGLSLLAGGTVAQDIQTMWFPIRRVLEKIKIATCNHFQASATLQAEY